MKGVVDTDDASADITGAGGVFSLTEQQLIQLVIKVFLRTNLDSRV